MKIIAFMVFDYNEDSTISNERTVLANSMANTILDLMQVN
jgi:hypothetical protein